MHFDWNMLLSVLVIVGTGIIHAAIRKPSDVDRARLIATLADDAAAVVVDLSGNAPWASLLRDTIARLTSLVPGENGQAIERAATAALVRLGKSSKP